jgi:alanyl-tRNA synthetase
VPVLLREMNKAYPELLRASKSITDTLKFEEIRFRRTLERGLVMLDEAVSNIEAMRILDPNSRVLPGNVAFTLYDTYGFPLDLTQDALRTRNIEVDIAGFNQAMERQRVQARASWTGSGEAADEAVWFALRDRVEATEFLGYKHENAEGRVQALVRDGQQVAELTVGDTGAVIVNQTPFYAESGGQVGDNGRMTANGIRFRVTDTQKKADGLIVHIGVVESGTIQVGTELSLDIDHDRRSAIRKNHSATHLLHEALRQILGDHVAQKGSLVAPDRLRFDFSHPKAMNANEIDLVENLANEIAEQNTPVETETMAIDDAMESGARALFGEKYGDEVRVVSMGKGGNIRGWSVELCGGIHVERTGDIGLISIVGESGVSAGVRRIEALTSKAARTHLNVVGQFAKATASELRTPIDEMPARVAALLDERKRLERELSEAKKKLAMGGGGGSAVADDGVESVGGVKVMAKALTGVEAKDLRSLADEGKKKLGSGVVILVANDADGKAALVVGVTSDLTGTNNAVQMVQAGAVELGGKGGGGRPDMAQGGGPNGNAVPAALAAIKKLVKPAASA